VNPIASLVAVLLIAVTTAAAGQRDVVLARLQYGGGGDWYANPSSLPNLLTAVAERTSLRVSGRETVVKLTDPGLWDVPYL
jgi:hypothetical protein